MLNTDELPVGLFPDEVWVPVTDNVLKGIQPWYVISNYGRVYNFKNKRFMNCAETTNHLYCHFRCIVDGKSKDVTYSVHRAMMLSFNYFPGCENLEADHIDECSYNNMLFNLQWLTREQNIAKFHNSYYNRYINQLQQGKGNIGDFAIRYYDYHKYSCPIVIHPCIFSARSVSPYEIFVPVRGYENRYEISNMGRMFDKLNGWFCISFRNKGEKYLYCYEIKDYIPLAMMKSFNYVNGCENWSIRFKDGNTFSNYLPNIEWDMNNFNAEYGDTSNCGSGSYMSTVTEDEVRKACELMQEGKLTYNEIAEIVGGNMSKSILNRIKMGNSWKHISKDYNFNSEKAIRYSEETKQKAIEMIKSGKYLQKEIMEILGIQSTNYIKRLKDKINSGKL